MKPHALLLITSSFSLVTAHALHAAGPFTSQVPTYTGFVNMEVQPGDNRTLTNSRAFVPLWQQRDSMIFTDVRGMYDDRDAWEGNFGLGLRSITDDQWVVGGYAYYDIRHSINNNNFNQLTIGAEAMSVDWEGRINGYIPDLDGQRVAGPGTAALANGTIVVLNGIERAYWGVDAEIGKLLHTFGSRSQYELRAFAGGFHFDNNAAGFPNATGPRTRLEFRGYDLPQLGNGSRVTLGLQYQWDEVRDDQVYAIARLRVPLSFGKRRRLTRLQRRMVDDPVRDVDIVGFPRLIQTEGSVTSSLTGQNVTRFIVIDAETEDPNAVLQAAGDNVLVIIDGSKGPIFLGETLQALPGQILIGGGSRLRALIGGVSGQGTIFRTPGTAPLLEYGDGSENISLVELNNGVLIQGLSTHGGRHGIFGRDVENFALINNNVAHAHGAGIKIVHTAGGSLIGNQSLYNYGDGVFIKGDVDDVLNNTFSMNLGNGFE